MLPASSSTESDELGATSQQLADREAELERLAGNLTGAEAALADAERALADAEAALADAEDAGGSATTQAAEQAARADAEAARAEAEAARADAEALRADLAESCLGAVADVLRRLYDSEDIADGLDQAAEGAGRRGLRSVELMRERSSG